MAVYFVYRCDETGRPEPLYRRRFEDATVIDWFRNHWVGFADVDKASEYADKLLGIHVYSFYDLFVQAAEHPPPATIKDVRDALAAAYFNEIRFEEHCAQVLTDDDDTDMAYYFFDDAFVKKHPRLTAYLLHDGPLPDGAGNRAWRPRDENVKELEPLYRKKGKGRIYVVPQMREDTSLYEDLDSNNLARIDGLRLPELCRQLMNLSYGEVNGWGLYVFPCVWDALFADDLTSDAYERAFVKALQAEPNDEATWRAYADWLMERGGPGSNARLLRLALPRLTGVSGGDPARNVVHAGEHVVEACIYDGGASFDQMILFDDLWAGAHPILAEALLRYGSCWDVLSTGNEQRFT